MISLLNEMPSSLIALHEASIIIIIIIHFIIRKELEFTCDHIMPIRYNSYIEKNLILWSSFSFRHSISYFYDIQIFTFVQIGYPQLYFINNYRLAGVLPWSNLTRLLHEYDASDTELLIYTMTLINKTLNGIPDQDTYYDQVDLLEEQDIESVIRKYGYQLWFVCIRFLYVFSMKRKQYM